MKLNSVTWIVSGVLVYLIFLIAYLPANQIVGRVPLPKNVSISGVSGSIWQVQAERVSVNGISVDQVNWQMSFWPLLIGRLSLDLDAGNQRAADQISLQGSISTSLSASNYLTADDLTAFVPAQVIASQLTLPVPVVVDGRVRLNIDNLKFDKQCESMLGDLQWLNASVGSNVGLVPLETFNADLSCAQGTTLVKIKEPNKLGLAADAKFDAKFKYSIQGRFKPDASLPKAVHDASVIFGRKDAEGYYQLKL